MQRQSTAFSSATAGSTSPGSVWGRPGGASTATAAASASSQRQQQPWWSSFRYSPRQDNFAEAVSTAVASGRSEAAASAIATAGSSGQATAVAESLATQIGAGRVDTVAEAVAQASASNSGATAKVLAQTARRARSRGFTDQFARSQARAFAAARRRGKINNYATTVAEAIATGGADAGRAYGAAFARAAAGSSEEQEALAEATAVVFCQGGKNSRAFAQAYAEALNRDPRTGCLVLSRARAIAVARCRGGVAKTYARATAESRVLGFCRQNYSGLSGLNDFIYNRNTESSLFRLGSLLSGIGDMFGW